MPTPSRTDRGPRRRNRTHQRERVLAFLRESDAHPTAAQIHDAIGQSAADGEAGLSLATVYRNLEVLVAEGLVDEVPVPGGAARYDGNPRPHHHFVCDRCGTIVDVEIPEPRGLRRRLQDMHALRARRVSIDFHGLCPSCEAHDGDERLCAGPSAPRHPRN